MSRSLAACEGAVLVVDASQGVEAQTVANCYTAIEQGVEVIPVLNKIDLPSADPGRRSRRSRTSPVSRRRMIRASAKTGENVDAILEVVIARVPAPGGDEAAPLVGSDHRLLVRQLRRGGGARARHGRHAQAQERILLMSTGANYLCDQVGIFTPKSTNKEELKAGEVGFVTAGIKEPVRAAKVGDTVTLAAKPAQKPP